MPIAGNPRRSATLRSANRHHQRRQSASERIDEILENARERADSIAAESVTSATATAGASSPPVQAADITRSSTTLSFEDHAQPDETTAFLQRRLSNQRLSSQNYQTLGNETGASLRARKSILSRPPSALDESHETLQEEGENESRSSGDAGVKWWDTAFAPFRSIELENRGSVARDHLALERTFLAWLRTSLAFASIGIAVTQLFRLNTSLPDSSSPIDHNTLRQVGKPLGAAFLVISIMILLLGYRRFCRGQQWIMEGKFPASRGTVIILVLVTLGIMILSLVVVIVIHPKVEDLPEEQAQVSW